MWIKKNSLLYFYILLLLFVVFTNSCKKAKKEIPEIETGSFTDTINKISYNTVKIGNQWWMAENLKGTKYRNGAYITKIQTDTAQWKKDTTGAYCIYDNNATAPGLLYNWYAVNNSNNIAPYGWHVPTDAEWKELEMHLGMSATDAQKTNWRGTDEGEKLKIASIQNWITYGDVWSNNESGFTALAGCCRMFDGKWGNPGLGSTGFWWASDTHSNDAWYRYLDYKNANVFRYYGPKTYGFSIRCVKD